MDRLETIELFVTGSFSEAGRRLGHAPSAVSRRIDDLERWMGANLFYRSTRRLSLTEVGRAFHGRSRQILLDLEEARVTSAQTTDHPTGTIRMTTSASFSPCLIGAMRDFEASSSPTSPIDWWTWWAKVTWLSAGSRIRPCARGWAAPTDWFARAPLT